VVDAEEAPVPANRRENLALQFVQLEEEGVQQRALEVEYLRALGINIIDSTLPLDSERIRLLPQFQRIAQYRWNHLYNVRSHKKLANAIARELKAQYDEYKKNNPR
jgi:hypothetical protein